MTSPIPFEVLDERVTPLFSVTNADDLGVPSRASPVDPVNVISSVSDSSNRLSGTQRDHLSLLQAAGLLWKSNPATPQKLSAYAQCFVMCLAAGVVTTLVFVPFISRVQLDYRSGAERLSDPGTVIVWLLISILLWAYSLERITLTVPWFMARTFEIKREEDKPKSWRDHASLWLHLSPPSIPSAIALLVTLYICCDALVWAVVFVLTGLSPPLLYTTEYRNMYSYISIEKVLVYTILNPIVFTSRFSVPLQPDGSHPSCTDVAAPWYRRILGRPISIFGLLSIGCVWLLQSCEIARLFDFSYMHMCIDVLPPILWCSQLAILVVEFLATSNLSHQYNAHPAYVMCLAFWYQYLPVFLGNFFSNWLSPRYRSPDYSAGAKTGVYLAFFSVITFWQYIVRILANRAVSSRMVLLFVFGVQVYEDAISDLAFLELDPFTLTFFITTGLHVIRTFLRDLDLWVNIALHIRRSFRLSICHLSAMVCRRSDYGFTASNSISTDEDRETLAHWHLRYDRFFLRHQTFMSEMTCKTVVLTLLLYDSFVASLPVGSLWLPTITTGMADATRVWLIVEVLFLATVQIATHLVVLAVLRRLERRELQAVRARPKEAEVARGGNARNEESEGAEYDPSALRWLTHDAWASPRVRVMLLVGVAWFALVTTRLAFVAAVGWKTQQQK